MWRRWRGSPGISATAMSRCEMLPNRIRARRDEAIEALLKSLGAKVALIEAPFEPEGGAYASGAWA